ncbi:MAG: hypothetical protein ACM3Q2_11835 [Syntrophothermus sp.]
MKYLSYILPLLFIILSSSAFAADTLFVKGKCAVFFEPTAGEADTLMLSGGSPLKDLTDFRAACDMIIPFLNKKMISVYTTDADFICFRISGKPDFIFQKTASGNLIGIILSDTMKDPQILPGVTPDTAFFVKYKNYFESK